MIGLANGDNQGVKNEMSRMGDNIDWDVLYQKLDKKERKYEKWYDLAKYVIKPAMKELKEKSDICFDFEGERQGHKMEFIIFHIYKNEPDEQVYVRQKILKEEENRQLEIPKDHEVFKPLYDEFLGHNDLTKEDLNLLLKKASYDTDKVRRAIYKADTQEFIQNYMGWIISCIQEDYTSTSTMRGDAKMAEKAKAIKADYEKDVKSGRVQKAVWNKTKTKEDFGEFMEIIKSAGLDEEQFETIYSDEEKVKMYVDYKQGRAVVF